MNENEEIAREIPPGHLIAVFSAIPYLLKLTLADCLYINITSN
jgi:hypothetical protein